MSELRSVAEALLYLGLSVLLVVALTLALQAVYGQVHGVTLNLATDDAALARLLPWLLSAQALVFIAVGGWLRRVKLTAGQRVPRLDLPRRLGIGIGVGAGTAVVVALIGAAQTALGFAPQEQSAVTRFIEQVSLLRVVPLFVIVAPLGEELFFRGYMFPFLLAGAGRPVAYGVSSVAFALVHFNPTGMPIYLTIGLILCWAYERWRSVALAWTAHLTYNLIVVLLAASVPGP